MRIIWKDTIKPKANKYYRDYTIYSSGHGWSVTLPNDNNIYRTYEDAMNMIDKVIGGHGKYGAIPRRIGDRISIIGTVDDL